MASMMSSAIGLRQGIECESVFWQIMLNVLNRRFDQKPIGGMSSFFRQVSTIMLPGLNLYPIEREIPMVV